MVRQLPAFPASQFTPTRGNNIWLELIRLEQWQPDCLMSISYRTVQCKLKKYVDTIRLVPVTAVPLTVEESNVADPHRIPLFTLMPMRYDLSPVLWIRIRRISMFLGLPYPVPSIIKQKSKKNSDHLMSNNLWLLWHFPLEKKCKCTIKEYR